MHLLLASVSASTAPTGVCRHAANIVRGMLACPSVRKVTMFTGDWQEGYFREAFGLDDARLEVQSVGITNSSIARNFWYLRGLPTAARSCSADIVHLAFPVPVLRSAYSVPLVLSLHDLYPFDVPLNFGKYRAWRNRAALRLCLRNVDSVACVSDATRIRLFELFPALHNKKASIVPNSIFHSTDSGQTALPAILRDFPFLLSVAQHRANKNLALLLRSFAVLLERDHLPPETNLVIVGSEGPETRLLHRIVAEWHLQDSVQFLHGISDSTLSLLYAKCELVIAPSLLEGFGLPVAEALAAGCHVACSDIAAFRAISAAAHCTFFDPRDASGESIVAAIRACLRTPPSSRNPSVGLAPQHAAAMYLALYSKLMQRDRTTVFQRSPEDLPASGDL